MVPGRIAGLSSVGQHDRCRLGGPKGLFLCRNFLCSLFFESHSNFIAVTGSFDIESPVVTPAENLEILEVKMLLSFYCNS